MIRLIKFIVGMGTVFAVYSIYCGLNEFEEMPSQARRKIWTGVIWLVVFFVMVFCNIPLWR